MSELLPLPSQPAGVPFPTSEWPTADLDPRVDADALHALLDHAFQQPEPDDLERTHAVVIAQCGAIVAERYAPDAAPDDAFASWSMAKSITQALVGILVRQGRLNISQPIDVPEWSADDPRRQITIDQMLRMVDGLRFREAEHIGGGSVRYWPPDESDVIPMLFGEGRDDVAGFAATLPKVAEPEEQWNYNSGASNLLSRLVSRTIGGGADEMRAFMQAELFGPLGMTTPRPTFDAAGTFVGSAYCASSARDFARFASLYLRDGVWDGQRILPEGWVDYTRTGSPQSSGTYGAHFWVIPGSLGLFSCQGAFGQRILISPALDLVVVRLGNTAAEKVGSVVTHCRDLVDAFRPTLG
ncbi:serine hydrolase domain-containing protein [Actinospongicola halichondriae]|uniref:serine hydrolase domain-containing protein n=1 Tax=Actinospongicola halichondriae TaxID=3236844 RepID=UPI003D5AD840